MGNLLIIIGTKLTLIVTVPIIIIYIICRWRSNELQRQEMEEEKREHTKKG